MVNLIEVSTKRCLRCIFLGHFKVDCLKGESFIAEYALGTALRDFLRCSWLSSEIKYEHTDIVKVEKMTFDRPCDIRCITRLMG